MKVQLIAIALLASSCSFKRSSLDKPDLTGLPEAVDSDDGPMESVELKQAKLWARIEQLETQLLQHEEKLKLLEKGLMLGIVPDELKTYDTRSSGKTKLRKGKMRAGKKAAQETAGEDKPRLATKLPAELKEPEGIEHLQSDGYQARLAAAREVFAKEKYGQAYLEFSKLSKDFEAAVTQGEPLYWIGRCWYQLREYKQAVAVLSNFVKAHSSSNMLVSAKYFLAKAELDAGLRTQSIKHLRELIHEHPFDSSTEAAKKLLEDIATTL